MTNAIAHTVQRRVQRLGLAISTYASTLPRLWPFWLVSRSMASVGMLIGMLVGCGSSDATGTAPLTASQTAWVLRLNEHAVTMAVAPPYNTLQLTAVVRTVENQPLPGVGTVHYAASDSSVAVSATGVVTAQYATVNGPSYVVASLRDSVRNLTLRDTVFFQVTPTAPAALRTFSIQPAVGDSAKVAAQGSGGLSSGVNLPVYATDVTDAALSNLLVAFTSSDPSVATITSSGDIGSQGNTGQVTGVRVGHVTITASLWYYGVHQHDSLVFTITDPINSLITVVAKTPFASVTPVLSFFPDVLTIGTGGVVTWQNGWSDPIDVVFDNPTPVMAACDKGGICSFWPSTGPGNIASFFLDTTLTYPAYAFSGLRARSFPVAGTYHYHSTHYGTTGTIVVR